MKRQTTSFTKNDTMTFNPYAIYINCDGAMDYDSKNTGGVGYVITFPDFIELETISYHYRQICASRPRENKSI